MLNTDLATSHILRSHGKYTVTCNGNNANLYSQPQHSGGFSTIPIVAKFNCRSQTVENLIPASSDFG